MRSKSCNGIGLALHCRFPDGQPCKLLISLSLLSKVCDWKESAIFSLCNPMSCLSSNEASEASEMPKFRVSSSYRHDYLRKDFNVPWSQFLSFNERLMGWQGNPSTPVWPFFKPTGHWACPCAMFLQYREAHYPFRFSSDGDLTR